MKGHVEDLMSTDGLRRNCRQLAAIAALGALTAGFASAPAYASSARSRQWHLNAMHSEKMWKTTRGEGIKVAVIDSGVDSSVPDLQGQVLGGEDLTNRPGGARDDYGHEEHGTAMATVIAGTGGGGEQKGTYGLAPRVKIVPIRVEEQRTDAENAAESQKENVNSISKAIRAAADSNAKIKIGRAHV